MSELRNELLVFPRTLCALFLLIWISCGLALVVRAPYASGTDESIRYVAFAAAKNRWATEADFRSHQIEHFYYPPLYFLLFAPWYGDNPEFVERYPSQPQQDPNFSIGSGGAMNSQEFLNRVPQSLLHLYRASKLVSLALGAAVLLCLAATLAALFEGPNRWWLILAGTAPAVFLPQFLYYHTLCNNDPLVNALGAAAILAFTLALGGGRGEVPARRFLALSLLTAVLVGLALLTKMSGVVLLPLLPALALAAFLREPDAARALRLKRSLGTLLLTGAAAFSAGGWWILRQGLMGDWSGSRAHRLAHPWTFKDVVSVNATEIVGNLYIGARSYVGMFTGTLYGVPDWVFLGFLLVPLVAGAAALWAFVSAAANGPREPRRGLRVCLWSTLAGLVAVNLLAVSVNALFTYAAHGRLLFPTLVASHALFAAVVGVVAARRTAWVAPLVLFLAVSLGFLFGWTFRNRLLEAVTQPPERVIPLSFPRTGATGDGVFVPDVWPFSIEQQLRIPPGRVSSIRVSVVQRGVLPKIGGALDGSLRLYPSGAPARVVSLRRSGLGDDLATRWPDLKLQEPLELREETAATLELRGISPWLPASRDNIGFPFAGVKWNVGQFTYDGHAMNHALSLAVVYAAPGRE